MGFSESILVRLGMDNTAFNRGLTGATQGVNRMKSAWGQLSGFIGFGMLTKRAFELADSIQRVQQASGLAVETIQTFQQATIEAGGSAESAEKNMKKFAENVGKAATEGGAFEDVFKNIGVNLRDANGALKGNEQLINEVADALKGIEDPSERAAVAVKLFGKGGHEMAAVLAQGSAELKKLRAELESVGSVMSESTIRELDRMDDTAKRGLDTASKLIGRTIGQVSQLLRMAGTSGTKDFWKSLFGDEDAAERQYNAIDRILLGEQQMDSALKKAANTARDAAKAQEELTKAREKAAAIDEKRFDIMRQMDAAQMEKDKAMRAPALAGSLEDLANADLSRGGTRQAFAQRREAQFIMGLEANAERLKQSGLTDLAERGFATARFRRQNLTLANEDVRNPLKKFDDQLDVLKAQLKVQEDTLKALSNGESYPEKDP